MKVKISDIKVGDRVRRDYGDIEGLAVDIQRHGLYHPIILDEDNNLMMGERRLRAHKALGMDEIEVKKVKDLDDLTKKEMEIEENLRRKDFTWQEEIQAKKEVNDIKRKLYGDAVKGHGGGWSFEDTAKSLGESVGSTHQAIKLAEAILEFPELAKEKNKSTAWRKYLRLKEMQLTGALAEKVKDVKIGECLVNGDSSIELKKLESNSIDLILTDPPFAIGLDKLDKMADAWADKIYDDEKYGVLDTLEKVLTECYRVLKDDRHIYVFFDARHQHSVLTLMRRVGFAVNPVPCSWNKQATGMGGSPYSYSSSYEPILFGMKGRRPLTTPGKANVFTVPRIPPGKKIHPTQKPSSLLRMMIEQSSLPGELVADPYAGSGSTLVSSIEVGRRCWGCEKDKDKFNAASIFINDSLKAVQGGEDE